LVVISPLAFVMYLLPNTEKYFSKWLSMFWKLLLVFPIIGLLLGGGQLASTVILAAGSQDPPDPNKPCETSQQSTNPSNAANISKTEYAIEGECGIPVNVVGPSGGGKQARQASWTTAIVALVVLFGPVVFSIGVLRAAMDAGGVVGGKIGGAVNNLGRGARGKVAKDAAQRKEDIGRRLDMRAAKNEGGFGDLATGGTFRRRGMRRNAIRENRKKELGRSTETYLADQIGEGGTGFARSMARGASDGATQRVASSAADVAHKREAEEVKAASIHAETLSSESLNAQLENAIPENSKEDPRIAAAINELAKRQDFEGLEKAIDKFGSSGNNLASRTLGSSIAQNNPGLFTAGQIGGMARGDLGGKTYSQIATGNIADGILSPEKMAEAGPSLLEEASRLSGSSDDNAAAAKASLINSVNGINRDLKLQSKLGRNSNQVSNIGAGQTYNRGSDGSEGTWS
ncbi:hypothetical protein HY312_03415, partial [Candidatus Saccharibacteria bacterium]|nr:hypothetical protein [Candidatus Saccharibacteria bacterium]